MSGGAAGADHRVVHFHPLKKLLVFGCGAWRRAGSARYLGNGNWKNRNGRRAFPVLLGTAVLVVALFPENETLYLRALPEHTGTESDSQQNSWNSCWMENEPIKFEDEAMKKYLEIYQSQNWMLIGGKLLSKKLALWFTMHRPGTILP